MDSLVTILTVVLIGECHETWCYCFIQVRVPVIDNPTQSTLPVGFITFNRPHNLPQIGLDFIWRQCPNRVDLTRYREGFYV